MCLVAGSLAQAAEVRRSQEATLGWAPAAGPVFAYGVWIAREGEPFAAAPSVWTGVPWTRIHGEWGERLVVRVAAFDARGVRGPFSPISEAIHFRRGDPAPRDLDGDGRSEILLEDASGAILTALTTDGTQLLESSGVALLGTLQAVLVATGDLDGDRAADLILRRERDGAVLVAFGGDLVAEPPVLVGPLALTKLLVAVGDLDGNGRDDIVVRDFPSGAIELWRMDGARIAGREALPTVDLPWRVLDAPDLDGDGRHDLLWRDASTGALYAWLMRGSRIVTGIEPTPALTAGLVYVGAGDLDGSGGDDLVWHDPRGRTLFWAVSGGYVTSTAVLVPPSGWAAGAVCDHDGDRAEEVLWWNAARGETALALGPNGATSLAAIPAGCS